MKHFRKVCAVLLAMLMVAVILPTTGLLNSETDPVIPSVGAAEVGVIVNGDFSQSEKKEQQQKDDGCGNMETVYYNHATGWEQDKWAVNITSGYANFSKDSSVANSVGLSQLVPVNTNATYKLTFKVRGGNPCLTYKITGGSQDGTVLKSGTPSTSSNSYSTNNVEFSTGSYDYVCIQFVCTGTGSSDSRLDDVSLSVVSAGDAGTHAKPTLKSFGTEYNRPASSSDNIIVQPGFEATTNAQWNTSDFLKQGVSIVTGDAEGAHSGSAYLKYYHGSVNYTEWPMFQFTCPTAGEYVFSAWVRTPGLSADNQGKASIGIINPDDGKFLCYGTSGGSYDGHYSNQEIQIRSTATDNDWHLRSVTFYVGENNSIVSIGMYGLKSTMYVDDISVHLLSKGVKYTGNQTGTLSASKSSTNYYCESEDNLIPDCNMNGSISVDFWSGASGWNNGFLEIAKDAQNTSRGNALHFKGTSPASNKKYRYVKFVSVEPNTKYYVSFDYRVVKSGSQLMFIDNNIIKNATFHTPSLSGNSWSTYTFSFNTGNYNRIGIVFQDGTGEAYYDDFRFFKDDDKTTSEPAEEVFPTLKHNKPGEQSYAYDGNTDNSVLESRMEMGDGKLGLAFLFNLEATGVTRGDDFVGNYTNGKVDAFETGEQFKLIKAGAVVTNNEVVGQDENAFKLSNLQNDKSVIDVNAKYLFDNPQNEQNKGYDAELGCVPAIFYAIRITNIPEKHIGTTIYVRPYYVFEYNGEEVTVYGKIVYDAYEQIPDINDGWMEWD